MVSEGWSIVVMVGSRERQAGRHGAGEGAEGSILSHRQEAEGATLGLAWALRTPNPIPNAIPPPTGHTYSKMAMPSHPSKQLTV